MILVTFTDRRMLAASERIRCQAEALNFYDTIHSWTDRDLESMFRLRFIRQLVPTRLGYGFFCWKPQVVLQALKQARDGDIIQYTDAGCHLFREGLPRLREYVEAVRASPCGVLGFDYRNMPCIENGVVRKIDDLNGSRIKGDVLDHFGLRGDSRFHAKPLMSGGVLFVRKCRRAETIIREWAQPCWRDFSLIDDTPSRSANLPTFSSPSMDEGLLSCVGYRHNVPTISAREYVPVGEQQPVVPGRHYLSRRYPIDAKRDKGIRDRGPIPPHCTQSFHILRNLFSIVFAQRGKRDSRGG